MVFRLVLSIIVWMALSLHHALAHEGHDHAPVSIKSALEIALKTAREYTQSPSPFIGERLAPGWAQLGSADARIHENGRGFYWVAVHNPQELRDLYIKILLDGEIAAATFDEKFPSGSASSKNSGG